MKRAKKFLSLVLCAVMVMGLVPCAAQETQAATGVTTQPNLTIGSGKVAYGGQEWCVIGDGSRGVYPVPNNITLLASSAHDDWIGVAYRYGTNNSAYENYGYQKYDNDNWYYSSNPDTMADWKSPEEYAGSILWWTMMDYADTLSEQELGLITLRDLQGSEGYPAISSDGITGQELKDQPFWALSYDEFNQLPDGVKS